MEWNHAHGSHLWKHVNGGKLLALPIFRPPRSADLTKGKDLLADMLVRDIITSYTRGKRRSRNYEKKFIRS